MLPNSYGRVLGNTNDEKKSANDHQKDNEYKGSAGAIGGTILIAHVLKVHLDLSLIQP